MKYQVLF